MDAEQNEAVLDLMEKYYTGEKGNRVVILPVEATLPRAETVSAKYGGGARNGVGRLVIVAASEPDGLGRDWDGDGTVGDHRHAGACGPGNHYSGYHVNDGVLDTAMAAAAWPGAESLLEQAMSRMIH